MKNDRADEIIALEGRPVKSLVLWHLDVGRLGPELIKAIAEQPNYGKRRESDGKLEAATTRSLSTVAGGFEPMEMEVHDTPEAPGCV